MVDLQAACYGIVSTFFVASTITILLRIYSRGFVVKSFGWDDWCMTAILVRPVFIDDQQADLLTCISSSTVDNKYFCTTSSIMAVDCKQCSK